MNCPRILSALCSALLVVFVSVQSQAQESETLGRKDVYRVQPSLEKVALELVPPEQVRPGMAYNYYHPQLGKRVWGIALPEGRFRYAFGEGTILPTEMLDLRISEEMQRQILERGAPGLRESLAITGDTPSVKLDAEGNWTLLQSKSGLRVFDLATGKRWEWHGRNRKAVLHTHGDRWQIFAGRYIPAGEVGYFVPSCCYQSRAGSVNLVMRTAN